MAVRTTAAPVLLYSYFPLSLTSYPIPIVLLPSWSSSFFQDTSQLISTNELVLKDLLVSTPSPSVHSVTVLTPDYYLLIIINYLLIFNNNNNISSD